MTREFTGRKRTEDYRDFKADHGDHLITSNNRHYLVITDYSKILVADYQYHTIIMGAHAFLMTIHNGLTAHLAYYWEVGYEFKFGHLKRSITDPYWINEEKLYKSAL